MHAVPIQTRSLQSTKPYIELVQALCAEFATTAVERDVEGGTPKYERDRLRQSGLLNLVIPNEYGGLGETWETTLKLVREFAKVDSSIAHVFSYHHLGVIIPQLFGNAEQARHFYTETVQHGWFWCNALNPRDLRAKLSPMGDAFRLNGMKSFCSGAKDSDMMPITALNTQTNTLMVLVVPTRRQGITVNDDWDNIGQRQTDSGSVTFHDVVVYPDEILGVAGQSREAFGTMRTCLAQLTFANIYLGIAQGAFEAATHYTQTMARPWLMAKVEGATQDPYILHQCGELWVNLSAAEQLTDRAGALLQAAWNEGWNLTPDQRGECAIAIAAAKVATTKIGLDVANRIFDLMGARATSAQYGFDRYWRNLRTFTLHDPVDYKLRDIGNWVLNRQLPTPNFYS